MLGFVAVLMLAPVTMPVPVLRGLVQDRFGVSDFLTSAFMSINMIGAILSAPLAGALADRLGRQKLLIVIALLLDAAGLFALTLDVPFWAFMAIRFFEGCAHITALSLLLSIAGEASRGSGRTHAMGAVGGGLTLGVAIGAPIGGRLGTIDALAPLQVGSIILVSAALLAFVVVPDRVGSARTSLKRIGSIARRETAVLVPYAFAFVDRFTVGFFTTTFVLYAKNVHELPVARIGMLLGLFLGPFALLAYPFARISEKTSRIALVAGGSLAYGVAVTTLGMWSVQSLPILMVTLGVMSAVMFVPSLLMVTDLAPPEIRSTALGGFNAAGSFGFMVGPIVGGAVSQLIGEATTPHTGYSAAFVVAGGAEIVCVLAAWAFLRRLKAAGRLS